MPSSNPLWFGYYPGDRPIPKRPDQRFPTPQIDMSDMGLNAVLDEAMRVAGKPAEMPDQLWDWVQGDLKFQFNIAASPYQQKGNELYAYDQSEAADVPGAYMQINLVDLAKDPKKTASKFVEKSLNTINPFHGFLSEGEFWVDLDTSRERAMWKEILKYDPTTPATDPFTLGVVRKAFVDSAGNPIKLNGNNIMQSGSVKLSVGATTPAGVAVATASVAEKDVYEDVAGSVMGFVAGKKSAFSRNGAYSGMQTSFINAAAVELSQKQGNIRTALAGQPMLMAVDTRIDSLVAENALIDKLAKFNKNPAEEGLADIRADLAKVGFTQAVPTASIQTKLSSLKDKIDDPTNGIRVQINSVRAGLTGPQLTRFNDDVRELEGVLNDALSICNKYTAPGVTSLSRSEAEKLLQDLTQVSSRFSNNRYSGGAYDRFLQSVSRRYFEGPDSLLKFNPLDAGGNQIMSDGYRSLGTLYAYQKRIYLQADGRDLLDAVFSGKGDLEKTYIWFGQVRDRIQMFTPGYWVGKAIDRTHGFGLVYKGDDVVPLHPAFNKSPLIRTHTFKESFDVTLGGTATKVTGKFTGGKHLEHFYKAWDRAKDGKLVGVATGTGVTYSANLDHHYRALFDAINGNSTNVGTLGAGMNYVLGGTNDMSNMVAEWGTFRTALQNSGIPFQFDAAGNLIDNPHNKALLDGFFKRIKARKLNAANIDPFVSRIGSLQIYASKLSLVQQKLFTKFGKFIDPWVHLRTATAKKIGDFAAKVISKLALRAGLTALGAATAGIATALAPVIEKVIQAVVARTIDKTKALVRAVLKGDFTGELNKMMDEAMRATEKVITCGCFVPMFLVFAIFMMMANIIVSISPIDRAKQAISAAVDLVTVDRPDPITSDNCVAETFTVSCNSYETGDQIPPPSCRHGDNNYWSAGTQCRFNIPYFAGNPARGPASDPTSVCNTTSPKKPYYGYALDIIPADPDNAWVYAPQIGGVTNWDISVRRADAKACATCSEWIGCSVTLSGNDATHSYRIFLLHLACTTLPEFWVGSVDPGYALAKLYNYVGGKHVHIEMTVDGSYVKPEDYMCN